MESFRFLFQPGTIISHRYEIKSEIGRGGYSVVYEALDLIEQKTVAAKLLVPPPAAAMIAKERMRREFAALQKLDHPYIVRVLDFIEDGPSTFLIMERVSGRNLQQVLTGNGPIPWERVVEIAKNLLQALDFSHNKGVLHRDVKPQNVLLDPQGIARLTDFGSARIEGLSTLTQSGFVGTIDYMDPPVLHGHRADARSDLYSLGLTLYFALTGKLPPEEFNDRGFHPASKNPELPLWFDQIIAQSTSKEPMIRFPTAFSFLEALEKQTAWMNEVELSRTRRSCRLCSNVALPGLLLCDGCVRTDREPGKMFLIKPSGNLRSVTEQVLQLCPEAAASSALKDASRGRKPLLEACQKAVPDLGLYFARHNLDVTVISKTDCSKLLSRAFWLFCGFVALIGILTSSFFWNPLLWITPLVLFAMIAFALFDKIRPLIPRTKSRSVLPFSTRASAVGALFSLENQSAKQMIGDVLAIATRIYAGITTKSWAVPFAARLNVLIESSCEAAAELDAFDETLAVLESRTVTETPASGYSLEIYCKCEAARDHLMQRLLGTMGALGALQLQIISAPEAADRTLQTCSQELRSEIELQTAILKELYSSSRDNGIAALAAERAATLHD